MKHILLPIALLATAVFLPFSCTKDAELPGHDASSNSVASFRESCADCVENWEDSKMTVTLATNLYMDVWNDATTTHYRVYRTGGALWGGIRYATGCVTTNLAGANLCTDCSSYEFSVPNPAGWTACTEVTVTVRVNGLGGPGGTYQGCTTYALRALCPQEVCYDDESAWSAGLPYNEVRGNWATYTPYTGTAATVTLYAGQTYDAGTVAFSAPDGNGNVTITISLNPGFVFEDVEENVKIQGYATAPSGNPSPGLFSNKGTATGSPFSMTVPAANFYGVHVDLLREIPCE